MGKSALHNWTHQLSEQEVREFWLPIERASAMGKETLAHTLFVKRSAEFEKRVMDRMGARQEGAGHVE